MREAVDSDAQAGFLGADTVNNNPLFRCVWGGKPWAWPLSNTCPAHTCGPSPNHLTDMLTPAMNVRFCCVLLLQPCKEALRAAEGVATAPPACSAIH